jgi:rhodanese-related sulfurtransferase
MEEQIPTVTKEEVLEQIEKGTSVVINVLAKLSYDEVHIKGSISVPFDKVENGELDAIGSNKDVITYCKDQTCLASKGAARILRGYGYNASAYEGGMKEWLESGLPVEGSKAKKK